ncbi:MAG TPA: sulfite exporter TauE/SafE family protein [Mycobacteriales bacterium]|jgi:uncharacterized membrane protein YfcA|nr:sulfite exporter TauE/SafE family protein [Mycobacteriales bacterium]
MDVLVVVTVALAVLMGLTMGMLGGGGSILTVPLLVYVAGFGTREAITASLVVVGAASAVALIPHARAGHIRWRAGALFAVTGTLGAYGGARLAQHLPTGLLLAGFAVVMLVAAVGMLRDRPPPVACRGPRCAAKTLALGAGVGIVTGLVGAGGGFMIVPALTLVVGLPIATAVGTSLLIITVNSAAGVAGHLHGVSPDWGLTAAVAAAAVVGSLAGGALVQRFDSAVLRKGFGWFVLAMGTGVLGQQLAAGNLGLAPRQAVPVAVAALAAAAVAGVGMRHRRRARTGP